MATNVWIQTSVAVLHTMAKTLFQINLYIF
jgi:hypothetical protein